MSIATINPFNNEVIKRFDALSQSRIEEKLDRAAKAFKKHKSTSFKSRATRMTRAADILEKEKRELGQLMTLEMGKPIKAAIQEAEKCAWACRYYAENAERFLADEERPSNATKSLVRYQPMGPILAVMPWNFPFWQVFRFAAPALMAGNVGLLKHASNVPQCALAIEDVLRRAGFDGDEFQTLLIGSGAVSAILEDPRIAAATLTGGEPAGSSVAATCGRVIKKTVLELGGSDPFIVMPSCDLEEAVEVGVTARNINNGQSCIAAKRFIVHAEIYDEFVERYVQSLEKLRVGDPMNEDTQIGPLATVDIVETIERQVNDSIAAGAKLLTGGKRLDGPGNFYAPTAISEIPKGSPAYREELFGPVALIFKAADIDEAIAIANDSDFGLGASAWSNDDEEIDRLTTEIEAGSVFINGMVASDPRLPFGGIKISGYGRELSELGIREFVNIKTVWIKRGGDKTEQRTATE
jgi:succinate-semialdehyde dehydrogenase/glutarate-semialdehyde dehydrogenase